MNENAPEIVVIGGGTGTSVALKGLRHHTTNLTAIVTAFDNGGSSGRLRDEFDHLSLGDIRQCLIALADISPETEAFRTASQYRFTDESSLNGHNLGNLFLSALTVMHDDIEIAVQMMARMLRISGQVVPVALQRADLCAELIDGSVLRGESTIDLRRFDPPPIKRVYLDSDVEPNARAIDAILNADMIVLGPGDLYTSVVPNLLVEGVVEAIRHSSAKTVYVCNVMTKHGETDGFAPVDFLREINTYLGGPVDIALINSAPIPIDIQQLYSAVKAEPVVLENAQGEHLAAWARHQVCVPLIDVLVPIGEDDLRVRHDPAKLAAAIVGMTGELGLTVPGTETGNEAVQVAD